MAKIHFKIAVIVLMGRMRFQGMCRGCETVRTGCVAVMKVVC